MAKVKILDSGPEVTAAATALPLPPMVGGAKWNDEAHQAMCGTFLDVVECAGVLEGSAGPHG